MSRHPRAPDDTDRGFLGRWSERKIQARETGKTDTSGPEADLPDDAKQTEANAPDQRDGAQSGAEEAKVEQVKTDEDMPDLETIDENTDMSDFFSPGVSEQLRNQALRRLWRLSKFNVVDALDDYNEDFRNFELLGDIVTADMHHRTEVEEQRRRDLNESEEIAGSEETEGIENAEDDGDGDQQDEQAAARTEPAPESSESEDSTKART